MWKSRSEAAPKRLLNVGLGTGRQAAFQTVSAVRMGTVVRFRGLRPRCRPEAGAPLPCALCACSGTWFCRTYSSPTKPFTDAISLSES